MQPIPADDGGLLRRAKWAALVFGAVLALSLPRAVLLPLLDRDEPRFAEASREMLQAHDFGPLSFPAARLFGFCDKRFFLGC